MKNEEPPQRISVFEGVWLEVEDGVFYWTVMTLVMWGIALADHDLPLMRAAWAAWCGAYLITAPFIVVKIGRRTPPGDKWRTAAWLAYGGAPAPLFFLPGLNTWPILVAALPIVVSWGIVAWLQAARETPPARPPRLRAAFLGGASVISGCVSLPLFAGAAIGLAMGIWDPPDIAWLAVPVIVGGCAPLAVCAAYASVRLVSAARQAWREGAGG